MVKLAFLRYGFDVHNVLHAQHYAPALLGSSRKPEIGAIAVVMEYLAPPKYNAPGWITLFDLFQKNPALVRKKADLIYAELVKVIRILSESKLVHGDLRSNNLMIYGTFDTIMEPIKVNVIDMEWAGRLGEAYYPEDRNPAVGYPGEAASCIGLGDDAHMVNIWLDEVAA